ncbi:hypothetical protein KKB10_00550 [Patescibacteria group bacterium]|nr:hypothetical protein [Patescibacteria group bacterium]MBU1074471.1 hypothetical protein [Patescibacteria group bacterium]MBU1951941.1 hypothetical protein [Patescibacteria group bacterium]
MLKLFRKFTYPFAAFLVVLYILVSFNEAIVNPVATEQGTVLSATVSVYDEPVVISEELAGNYQTSIKNIVLELEFFSDSDKMNSSVSEYQGELNNIEQRLLKHKVPEVYQNLHLELVSVTNKLAIISDLGFNETDVLDVKKRLEEIKDQYAWF